MFGRECWCWNNYNGSDDSYPVEPHKFSLPSPIPKWPQGKGFATGRICLGEIEVVQITKFKKIWGCSPSFGKSNCFSFYKPDEIPQGFSSLGHYCQPDGEHLTGYVLAAKDLSVNHNPKDNVQDSSSKLPALQKPLSYTLIWSSDSKYNGSSYIWLPNAPVGYKSMGFVASVEPNAPDPDEVRCVRADLTAKCEACEMMFSSDSISPRDQFQVWKTRPCKRGMLCKGVSVGTFFCNTTFSSGDELDNIACLKNLDSSLHAMPNLEQIHALIKHYGPTVYLHPDEIYLPSSVPWFFINGALLYKDGRNSGIAIDSKGSNLPAGGENDGEYWLDLPNKDDANRTNVKCGNIESAELYVHVKPALGGTFTDVAMWIFCPFNGPATLKVGLLSFALNKVGEHVGDWEHYTLRISNFSGELSSVYFSEHSGGEWLDACNLEFIEGNKSVVYAPWLQYMREWGPTIIYDGRSEVEKIIKHLPFFMRFSVESIIELFPTELYGEAGPTGPKEKDNWLGDERW